MGVVDSIYKAPGVHMFYLMPGQVFCCVALCWVGAGVAQKDSFQVDLTLLSTFLLVIVYNFVGQQGNIDPCVAFPSDVEVIIFQRCEFLEESHQSHVVVLGCRCVVGNMAFCLRKSYSGWTFQINYVGVLVPSEIVDLHRSFCLLEHKGPILAGHSHQRAAAWPSIEPENYRVILLGVFTE